MTSTLKFAGAMPALARAALACLLLLSAAHGAPAVPAHAPVLRHYAALVHATYADALAGARELQQAVQRFVTEPSEATLADARRSWRAARETYGQSEAFRFSGGPVERADRNSGSPEGRLNAWPVDDSYLDAVGPESARGLIHDAAFVIDKANLIACNERDGEENVCTGWHAIEYLLWGADRSDTGPGNRSFENFVDAKSSDAARRRAWLSVATELLVDDLAGLARAWAPATKSARHANFRVGFEHSGHTLDGRGAMPASAPGTPSDAPAGLVIRLSVPGVAQAGAGVVPEPVYGEHLNKLAVEGVAREGRVMIGWQALRGRFSDGTPYVLQQPRYSVVDLAYGPLAPDVRLSPRLAPQLMGVGLLESIADADILQNAARQAATRGPIKGQVNRVWDTYAERELIGRFGWKANAATLRHQTAAAFLGDMGITSPRLVKQACTSAQADCLAARAGGWKGRPPEITDAVMDDVVFYQAALAPAAQRDAQAKQVQHGAALFAQAQCAACHQPSYTTGQAAFLPVKTTALQGQRIWPYTDLLLHDMGPDLADGRPDHLASARQWKTPPLWGIGLLQEVNGQTRLMHDGRADGVLEAILWHGGEAQAAKDAVLRFSAAQRAALVRFVMSL